MVASRSRPCDAMKNILLVVAWCDLAPSSQSTFVVIAYCDTTYQGTIIAVFFAASQGLPFSRLIVARAIPIGSRTFATVAIRCSVRGAAVVATAIVDNTTITMALISAVDDVVASIIAKSDLTAFFFAQFFDRHRLLRYDVKKYARRSRFLQ
jgi:uncharacterized protein YgbK (DUF1537 family)